MMEMFNRDVCELISHDGGQTWICRRQFQLNPKHGRPLVLSTKYPSTSYNLLLPTKTIQAVTKHDRLVFDEVMLSIEGGDACPLDHTDPAQANKFRLSNTGLLKLSRCAGIVWDPMLTRRIDSMKNNNFILFQAVGALKQADGTWTRLKGTYELDLEIIEQEIRDRKQRSSIWMERVGKAEWKDESGRLAWIEASAHSEFLEKQRVKLALAQTGAMNRVIRSLLAIKPAYTRSELEKPFVVCRVAFVPESVPK